MESKKRLLAMIVVVAAMTMLVGTAVQPASAIQWPLSLADAKAYGESVTANVVLSDKNYNLDRSTPLGVSASMTTPFQLAAFVYATRKATYSDLSASDLTELKSTNYLAVTARAFSTILNANDGMVVVLKQNGKVIRSNYQNRLSTEVTEYPQVGYRTTRNFEFPLSSFDYTKPLTVVIANAVTDGAMGKEETTWDIDPNNIR